MIELEKTFLAKSLPSSLSSCPTKEIIDIYIPEQFEHPKIRIRQNGHKFEITKKEPLEDNPSEMLEQTINITLEEFNQLQKLPGKKIHKIRYLYNHDGQTAEFDIFQDKLYGLVIIDFEFDSIDKKTAFTMPEFCLCDITKEQFTAGGMICGKSYEDIENKLDSFGYKKLSLS